jgi:hypothetical protein
MRKELDMRNLTQVAGGADEEVPLFVLEPVFTEYEEEDNTNTRWRKKRPRSNTFTLEPVDTEVVELKAIIVP